MRCDKALKKLKKRRKRYTFARTNIRRDSLTVHALTRRGSCCNCNNCTQLFIIKARGCGWMENFALTSPNGFSFIAEVSPTSLRNGKDPIVPLWRVSRKKTESANVGSTDSCGGRKVRGQALNPLLYPNLENKRAVRACAQVWMTFLLCAKLEMEKFLECGEIRALVVFPVHREQIEQSY